MAAPPSAPASATARGPQPWLLLCCVLVALLASYLPVLGAPLVWDDHHLIDDTPLVQQLHPLWDYFGQSFWQSDELGQGRTYYRPLIALSLALDHSLYGESPGGYHATNVLVHLLSTVLLFRLLRVRGVGGYSAVLGTALWALHPRLTEAVAWVSGRTDVLACFFVLCALLAQARGTWPGRVLSALCLLLGLMCKEVALAGVLAVLVTELATHSPLPLRLRRLAPTVLAVLVYVLFRLHAAGLVTAKLPRGSGRALPALAAVGQYLAMLLTPWFPNVQIGWLPAPRASYALVGALVVLALGYALVRFRRHIPRGSWDALALTAVGFGLVLHVVPFSINVIAADRFLYVPLLGLTLLLAPVLPRWLAGAKLLAVACALLALSYAGATFARANSWADEVELWAVTYRSHPDNEFLACTQLGHLYVKGGLFGHAFSLYRACKVSSVSQRVLISNGASVLARTGRYAEAAQLLATLGPEFRSASVYGFNLALFKTYLNDFAGARAELARVLAADPKYENGLQLARQLPELERLRRRLDALPAAASPVERARAYASLGMAREALEAWRAAFESGTLTRAEYEEGLSYSLEQGDAPTTQHLAQRYAARFAGQAAPTLQIAYEAHQRLLERLLGTWPSLNVPLQSLDRR